jgi:hypothetical protein
MPTLQDMPPHSRRARLIAAPLSIAMLTAILGCGPATARVEGVVTLDGQSLPNAMVQFFPAGPEGRTAAVQTDASGRFAVDVSPHPMRVAITARQVVGQVKDGDGMADVLKELVPDRYRDASTSELAVAPAVGTVTKAEFSLATAKR